METKKLGYIKRVLTPVRGRSPARDAKDKNAEIKQLKERVAQLEQQNDLLLERLAAVHFSEQQALKCLRRMQHESLRKSAFFIERMVDGRQSTMMKTDGAIGAIHPGEVYHTHMDNLELVPDAEREAVTVLELPTPGNPEKLTIKNGFTDTPANLGEAGANVLGGNLVFLTEEDAITIPGVEATPENFAFYGCYLVPLGSNVAFETPQIVPITLMTVGERYVENYLLHEERGGGFFVEYHDCPHFHQPLNEESGGWLALGKFSEDHGEIHLSAFNIPFGYGVYMPPNVIHCDSFLTGRFLVAYTAAKNFTTGILRTMSSHSITKVNIHDCKNNMHIDLDVEHPREFYCRAPKQRAKRDLMRSVMQSEVVHLDLISEGA